MSWELFGLAGLGMLGGYWYLSMQVREQAIAAGRRACSESRLQFLDDSVSSVRVRIARDGSGQMRLQRDYHFEFSDTGDNRRPGVVRMLGKRVDWVSLDGEWQPGHLASVSRIVE